MSKTPRTYASLTNFDAISNVIADPATLDPVEEISKTALENFASGKEILPSKNYSLHRSYVTAAVMMYKNPNAAADEREICLKALKKLANSPYDYPGAKSNLGIILVKSENTRNDAWQFLQEAFAMGRKDGEVVGWLTMCYFNGWGTKPNYTKALELAEFGFKQYERSSDFPKECEKFSYLLFKIYILQHKDNQAEKYTDKALEWMNYLLIQALLPENKLEVAREIKLIHQFIISSKYSNKEYEKAALHCAKLIKIGDLKITIKIPRFLGNVKKEMDYGAFALSKILKLDKFKVESLNKAEILEIIAASKEKAAEFHQPDEKFLGSLIARSAESLSLADLKELHQGLAIGCIAYTKSQKKVIEVIFVKTLNQMGVSFDAIKLNNSSNYLGDQKITFLLTGAINHENAMQTLQDKRVIEKVMKSSKQLQVEVSLNALFASIQPSLVVNINSASRVDADLKGNQGTYL